MISEEAKRLVDKSEYQNKLRCEHGYPRAAFVRKLVEMYKKSNNKLNKERINRFIKEAWDVAWITKLEDKRITERGYHSKHCKTAKQRWGECEIQIIKNPYYK